VTPPNRRTMWKHSTAGPEVLSGSGSGPGSSRVANSRTLCMAPFVAQPVRLPTPGRGRSAACRASTDLPGGRSLGGRVGPRGWRIHRSATATDAREDRCRRSDLIPRGKPLAGTATTTGDDRMDHTTGQRTTPGLPHLVVTSRSRVPMEWPLRLAPAGFWPAWPLLEVRECQSAADLLWDNRCRFPASTCAPGWFGQRVPGSLPTRRPPGRSPLPLQKTCFATDADPCCRRRLEVKASAVACACFSPGPSRPAFANSACGGPCAPSVADRCTRLDHSGTRALAALSVYARPGTRPFS